MYVRQTSCSSSDSSPCPSSIPPPDAALAASAGALASRSRRNRGAHAASPRRRSPPWPCIAGAGAAAISWPLSAPAPGHSRVLPAVCSTPHQGQHPPPPGLSTTRRGLPAAYLPCMSQQRASWRLFRCRRLCAKNNATGPYKTFRIVFITAVPITKLFARGS